MIVYHYKLIRGMEYRIVVKYNNDNHTPLQIPYEFYGKFIKISDDKSNCQVVFIDKEDNKYTWVSILNEFHTVNETDRFNNKFDTLI